MSRYLPALSALLASALAALALTPAVRSLARRTGFVARPSADRWHREPTALMGGIAILLAIAVGAVVAAVMSSPASPGASVAALVHGRVVGLAALSMFLVGLADDTWRLRPQTKFVLQVLAGTVIVGLGLAIRITPWYAVNVLVTVFWFVGVTNAFNLLDNMDGVSAGVAGIAAFFLGLTLAREGAWLSAGIAWALTGAALGFLRYNFSPASIFMGDAGSLLIGSLLACLVIASPQAASGSLVSVLFVPLAIIAVPVGDTALVSVTRTLAGRAISQGGRDHTTHRLVALGLSERNVALLLYAFAAVGGLIALTLSELARDAGLIVGTIFLVALSLLAAYLGRLHIEHPNEARGARQVTVLVTKLLYKRSLAKMLLDVVLVTVAYYAAFRLRFDGNPTPAYALAYEATLGYVVLSKIALLYLFGVYRGAWRYAGVVDMCRIVGALLFGAAAALAIGRFSSSVLDQSHSIIYIDLLVCCALVLASRLSFRALDLLQTTFKREGVPVLVYGAGDAGELTLRELRNNRQLGLVPVGLIDDDVRTHGTQIHGLQVVGGIDGLLEAVQRYGARRIVLATKKISPERRAALAEIALGEDLTIIELNLQFRAVVADQTPRAATPAPAVGSTGGFVRPSGAGARKRPDRPTPQGVSSTREA